MTDYLLQIFSRDLQDVTNDDESSYVETQGLLNTLYINSVIFAVLMTFYEMNRHMRSIYLKRLTSKFKVGCVQFVSYEQSMKKLIRSVRFMTSSSHRNRIEYQQLRASIHSRG